jgi:hypothetical protein
MNAYQRVRPVRFTGYGGVAAEVSGMFSAHPEGDWKVVPADALVVAAGSETHAALTELRMCTTSESESAERLRNAVSIAQMRGVSDEALTALLHLAAAGEMTPTVRRRLRKVGINPDPDDVIVIERGDLPEVQVGDVTVSAGRGGAQQFAQHTASPEFWRMTGLNALAIERHLRENPPIDEAQVEALAEEISNAYGFGRDQGGPGHVARHLVQQGWTKSTTTTREEPSR